MSREKGIIGKKSILGMALGNFMLVSVFLTGCTSLLGEAEDSQTKGTQTEDDLQTKSDEQIYADSIQLAEDYRTIYEKAQNSNLLNALETEQSIMENLGDSGYSAVDSKNQIDMVNAKEVEEFCKNAKDGKNDQVTLLLVTGEGGFVRYDLTTQESNIAVTESYLDWVDGNPRSDGIHQFDANTWKYTENGYLFIEEYQPVGYDGAPGQVGFRVKPLDEECRKLNREYVMPIGFYYNNLFITDWNRDDYSALDFYDLYERLYRIQSGGSFPYESGYEPMDYEIPKVDFETLIQKYFPISHDMLAQNANYNESNQTYPYRTRGFADSEFPYEPYPEVVAYKENADGTLTLTVQAVWIWKERDQAINCELVVQPQEDASFQYISNHVLADDGQGRGEWYTVRGAE